MYYFFNTKTGVSPSEIIVDQYEHQLETVLFTFYILRISLKYVIRN